MTPLIASASTEPVVFDSIIEDEAGNNQTTQTTGDISITSSTVPGEFEVLANQRGPEPNICTRSIIALPSIGTVTTHIQITVVCESFLNRDIMTGYDDSFFLPRISAS